MRIYNILYFYYVYTPENKEQSDDQFQESMQNNEIYKEDGNIVIHRLIAC